MKKNTSPCFRLRLPGGHFLATLIVAALIPSAALAASAPLAANPATDKSPPIPLDQLGAVAGKQYQGDGLTVSATPEGARLRCVFQRLEGEAMAEGLWLTSTVANDVKERFRVVAVEVGRAVPFPPSRSDGLLLEAEWPRWLGDPHDAEPVPARWLPRQSATAGTKRWPARAGPSTTQRRRTPSPRSGSHSPWHGRVRANSRSAFPRRSATG